MKTVELTTTVWNPHGVPLLKIGRDVHGRSHKGNTGGPDNIRPQGSEPLRGGVVRKHPSLKDLDVGDLKFHTDFRAVYATLLDGWLGCDSKAVLGARWDHVQALRPKA